MTTPILKITEAANGQVDQYLTYNEALRALESSTNNFYVVDMSSGDVTLTDAANTNPALNYIFSRNQVFRTTGNTVARVLTVPQTKRLFVVQNGGTFALTVKRGTSEIVLPASAASLFYVDGTTNGLLLLSASSTSSIESISGGVGVVINDDDPNNPVIDVVTPLRYPLNVFSVGVNSSAFIAGYPHGSLNSEPFNVLSNSVQGGGWLVSNAGSPWIDIAMPFAVAIGDSIVEGHPSLHGRLHPGGIADFDPDYASSPGQINFRLSELTNAHWYNHGIGGQTTAQILARFERDALGRVSDPGDGRGDKTLDGPPYAVIVCAGVNDIATGVAVDTIFDNLVDMCEQLRSNNIIPIFMTVGQDANFDGTENSNLAALNFLITNQLPDYGAHIVDFYSWGSDGSGGVNPDLYVDNVHPSEAGYTALADFIINSVDADLVMESLRIGSVLDPSSSPVSWSKPVLLEVSRGPELVKVQQVGDEVVIVPGYLDPTQTAIARITLSYPTSGVGGLSRAVGVFGRSCVKNSQVVGVKVAGVIQKTALGWVIASGFVNRGMLAISQDASKVTVTTLGCAMYFTGLVGSAAVTNDFKVSAAWGNPPASSCDIRFGDGSVAIDPAAIANGCFVSVIGVE